MQKALTFGIEIEMAVASVPADTPSEPLEHRICRFDDTSPNGEREPWRIVGEHIARTLHAAGFESSVSDVDESHSTKWDLTYDTSVSLGEFWNDSRARPVESMELRSPALHSTEKAYDAIQEVCAILSEYQPLHGSTCPHRQSKLWMDFWNNKTSYGILVGIYPSNI
jgi:hypothetical protein